MHQLSLFMPYFILGYLFYSKSLEEFTIGAYKCSFIKETTKLKHGIILMDKILKVQNSFKENNVLLT